MPLESTHPLAADWLLAWTQSPLAPLVALLLLLLALAMAPALLSALVRSQGSTTRTGPRSST